MIKLMIKSKYREFEKTQLYQTLKKAILLRKLKLLIGKIHWKFFPAKYRLHDDPILQSAFELVGKEIKTTSIVETGTFMGYSTSLMAEQFPQTPIFTSEINPINFKKSSHNLKDFKNIKVYKGTSPKFLEYLIKEKKLGEIPLFFLDAHWLDNWPLEDEMEIITNKIKKAVILIDDFKIPNDDRFAYDKYGNKECSLELIKPRMNKKNKYNLLLPNYGEDVFKGKYLPAMSGYPIIFQNMQKEFKEFLNNPLIKKFFVDRSDLINL
jgi:hypothetical protein